MNAPDHGLLTFSCRYCGIELEVPRELAGETGPCPACEMMITAPRTEPEAPDPAHQTSADAASYGDPSWLQGGMGTPEATWEEAATYPGDLAGPDSLPPVAGFGEVIAPPGATVSGEAPLPQPQPMTRGSNPNRGRWFPLIVGVLSLAIVGLAGMLLWRSEIWKSSDPSWVALDEEPPSLAAGPRSNLTEDADPTGRARQAVERADPVEIKPPNPSGSSPAERASGGEGKESGRSRVAELMEETRRREARRNEQPAPAKDSDRAAALASLNQMRETPKDPQSAGETGATEEERRALAKARDEDESGAPSQPVEERNSSEVIPVAGAPSPDLLDVTQANAKPGSAGPQESAEEATRLDRARKAVRRFLEAESWTERVPFVFEGSAKQTEVRDYYQEHPDRPISDYRLDFFHSEAGGPGELSTYVFFLTLKDEKDGFPVMVKGREGERFGVDWDLYVEFKDRHFAKFVENRGEKPREFRVVIQRVTYWEEDRDEIPGIENLVCYKIDPPYPGYTQFAFVEKDSEAGKRMVESLSWETDPLAARVRVHWEEFPNGRPYLTVTELVSRSWAN